MFFRRKIRHLLEEVKLPSCCRHALFEVKSSVYGIYDRYDGNLTLFTSKKKNKKKKKGEMNEKIGGKKLGNLPSYPSCFSQLCGILRKRP